MSCSNIVSAMTKAMQNKPAACKTKLIQVEIKLKGWKYKRKKIRMKPTIL